MNAQRSLNLQDSLILVSCVKSKLPRPAPAKELYMPSDWFRKARALVEFHRAPWFILSALHGLLPPDKVIEPYELTLKTMKTADRRAWADKVWSDLEPLLGSKRHVTFLAGQDYRQLLAEKIRNNGITVDVPMEGLRSGMQLQWLKKQMKK